MQTKSFYLVGFNGFNVMIFHANSIILVAIKTSILPLIKAKHCLVTDRQIRKNTCKQVLSLPYSSLQSFEAVVSD